MWSWHIHSQYSLLLHQHACQVLWGFERVSARNDLIHVGQEVGVLVVLHGTEASQRRAATESNSSSGGRRWRTHLLGRTSIVGVSDEALVVFLPRAICPMRDIICWYSCKKIQAQYDGCAVHGLAAKLRSATLTAPPLPML
jgi:hypothetical protein